MPTRPKGSMAPSPPNQPKLLHPPDGAAGGDYPGVFAVENPSTGFGELYVKVPLERHLPWAYRRFLYYQAEPWHEDGREPLAWWGYQPTPFSLIVFVVASREVDLRVAKREDVLPRVEAFGTVGYIGLFPEVQVIRVESRDEVPSMDEAFAPGAAIPAAFQYLGSEVLDWPPEKPAWLEEDASLNTQAFESERLRYLRQFQDWLRPERADLVEATPRLNGLRLENANQDWGVDLAYNNTDVPGGYAYEIIYPDPRTNYHGDFLIRVAHTASVDVSAFVTKRAINPRRPSQLRIEHAEVDWARLPAPGAGLSSIDEAEFEPVTRDCQPDAYTYALIEFTLFAAGFIPVVGTALDLAELGCMYAYGKTLSGDKVTKPEMMAQMAFMMMGCVGDFAEASRLLGMMGEGKLFAGAGPLISRNPGLLPAPKSAVTATMHPVMLDVLRKLPPGEKNKVLTALEDHVLNGAPYAVLAKAFDDVIHMPFRQALLADRLPRPVYVAAFLQIHPTQLQGFTELALEEQLPLLRAFNSFLEGTAELNALLAKFTPQMADDFRRLFYDARMAKVFNVFFDGFHDARLEKMYAAYVARKQRKGLPFRSPVEWAAAQRSGMAYDLLLQELGGDFAAQIRRYAADTYWRISDSVADEFAKVGGVPMAYEEIAVSHGRYLERDHALEQRFAKYFEEKLSRGQLELRRKDFQAVVVPRNPAVARQLTERGLQYYYVHSVKTRMMQRLIPHGTETAYRLQEIYEAHVIVFFKLGLRRDMVQRIVLGDLKQLSEFIGEPFVDTSYMTLERLLLRNPKFARRLR